MAITPDSGVRSNATVDLSALTGEDRNLITRRQTHAGRIAGLEGVDVPINAPEHHEPHVAPLWIMYGTFAALMLLTAMTVGARFVELGPLNIWVALGLAFTKAVLVGLFFMHLWWDTRFNQMVLVSTLLFLAIFIGIVMLDTDQYQPNLDPPGAFTQMPEGLPTQQALPPTGEEQAAN